MWYTKTLLDGENTSRCPNCDSIFPYGPIFDHHGSLCPTCKIELVELQINGELILIDTNKSPKIVSELLSYLNRLNEHEAFNELLCLMKFLGVNIKSNF